MWPNSWLGLATLALISGAACADVLSTTGVTNCNNGTSSITVNNVDISFDRSTNKITFDVSGHSDKQQEVTASLVVTAYGVQVFQKDFDPCDASTKVDQLCPVPAGDFGATGTQEIPSSFATMIPSIAYSVPDLEGNAQMVLKAKDGGQELACVQSGVSNGKTLEVPAVSYVAAAIAAAALVVSLIGAAAAGGHPGSTSTSPGFLDVMWWFQGLAMNGMLSVPYPALYRSFTKNFAFSTGLIPWAGMQHTIDSFRSRTGGNLTDNNFDFLRNATLVFADNGTSQTTTNIAKREVMNLFMRQISTTVNGTTSGSNSTESSSKVSHLVSGIQAYVEQLSIPESNTFMTVLLIFAIVIAAIGVGILLLKVILEAWSLFGKFPKSLTTFRKEYWRILAQTIVSLILLLYGIWTLYCIFQFTNGDSWAAKVLAGVTLALFTAILVFYAWKISSIAHKLRRAEGDANALFEDKETWKKYKTFYSEYKRSYWWIFMPYIVYMFAKGCILAAGNGHGLVQSAGQLIVEALMLILLLWCRPYSRKSANWINIVIQVVRVLSVVCILVFVQELGIAQTTKTITGVVLVAVQASLTAILAILIVVNSIITCVRENPHRKRRKAAAKAMEGDLEGDSFLMNTQTNHQKQMSEGSNGGYEDMRAQALARFGPRQQDSNEYLVSSAASMGNNSMTRGGYRSVSQGRSESQSPPRMREPTLPQVDYRRYDIGQAR